MAFAQRGVAFGRRYLTPVARLLLISKGITIGTKGLLLAVKTAPQDHLWQGQTTFGNEMWSGGTGVGLDHLSHDKTTFTLSLVNIHNTIWKASLTQQNWSTTNLTSCQHQFACIRNSLNLLKLIFKDHHIHIMVWKIWWSHLVRLPDYQIPIITYSSNDSINLCFTSHHTVYTINIYLILHNSCQRSNNEANRSLPNRQYQVEN